jgi:hypothetical protein
MSLVQRSGIIGILAAMSYFIANNTDSDDTSV